MENINEQFKRLFCELDLTDDQAAMIKKLQKDVDVALRQPLVSGSLQDRLFELANDFAKDKQGDVAVKLHGIHNGLQ